MQLDAGCRTSHSVIDGAWRGLRQVGVDVTPIVLTHHFDVPAILKWCVAAEAKMKYTDGTLNLTMISVFSRPFLKLGVKAVDIMEAFYNAIQTPRPPKMGDLITAGGSSYADLKLSVLTFGSMGRVDVTPALMGVDLREVEKSVGGVQQAKEHFSLCESTLATAIDGLEISERLFQARLWLTCEGGANAVEAFLAEKGDAAFKLSGTHYRDLKKQYSLELRALNPSNASRIELKIEPATTLRDLFLEFRHTAIGSPTVAMPVAEHFDLAEKELQELFKHIGLVSGVENAQSG